MDALRELLVSVAGRGEVITYEEVRAAAGIDGDIVPVLRALSETEDDAGRGLLTAVVVRADTGRPGGGWFRLAAERGRRAQDDPDIVWHLERELLRAVHGRPKSG